MGIGQRAYLSAALDSADSGFMEDAFYTKFTASPETELLHFRW
jgi:hypothetical protein